ncbi:MAG: 1-deoxy-D-xylulose-5-phosphate synthase [Defluviitaleaceae bacterium]|nr:1-deoxy-D-xylulose-5-phosphate synthase [Defluviitaleaceae bacterium]
MLLEHINSPQKLKRLPPQALDTLAAEIREFLVESIADTGGHLASNLGVVELTLALHRVFDSPKDKIIWDVGHQSYIHKIITGRKDRFHTLRKLDGLSGFPKPVESEHDAFGTGHSSTSISAALGLAMARDLSQNTRVCMAEAREGRNRRPDSKCCAKREKIIAVIGDGSMTGGLAYEGLNNAGRSDTDIIVVLNDNQMSIAENVGAISRHLNALRTGPLYLGAKQGVHSILDKLPVVGPHLSGGIESTKAALKYLLLHGVLFEEMGFRYFGPVDGHNIPALLKVLKGVKTIRGPVLVHVLTKKGKGYESAERSPMRFHGVGAFDKDTGRPTSGSTSPSYTDVFSKALMRHAIADAKIVAVTAAMGSGTGLAPFEKRFSNRFFDVGIAEGHAVTFAAGLAKGGLRPVVTMYASFLQRAYDNVVHDVALQNLPVVFAIDRAGLVGEDGETHQGIYDLAYLSHIPNMTVLAPKDGPELEAMLEFALAHNGPVAIRYPRDTAGSGSIDTPGIVWGKSQVIRQGRGMALVSVGTMNDIALRTADILEEGGHEPSVYNARFIKPLDEELVRRLAGYEEVYVLEDAARIGGYGTQLLEALTALPGPLPKFHIFAFPDKFIEAGSRAELFMRYNLDPAAIAKIIKPQ